MTRMAPSFALMLGCGLLVVELASAPTATAGKLIVASNGTAVQPVATKEIKVKAAR